ncbi:MAG: thioredoxin domain-containing protein [Candidatus Liptonbacteria bacterium]
MEEQDRLTSIENGSPEQISIVEEQVVVAPEKRPIISLPVSILAAAILISGAIIYSANQNSTIPLPVEGGEEPEQAVTVPPLGGRDVVMGNKDAKVTFIEYGDYQCPFCGRFFTQIEADLIDDYVKTGKVKFIYRDLAFLGPESVAAAEAAECSKDQNKFWQFHDAIYAEEIKDGQEHNNNLTKELFIKLAKQVGMNADEFTKCYVDKKYSKIVADNVRAAQNAGINSTPTSFINDQKISGAQPYATFTAAIDALLK